MEASPNREPGSLPPGTELGAWRVVGLGARGSYGVIYRVERRENPKAGIFALKLALSPLDPRFEREAELLSRIDHPNVPRLHDRGEWTGSDGARFPFLVMDWVEGLPLYSWARAHLLTSSQVLRLLAQVARALEATHAAGGIHRDVKGGNILVSTKGGRAVLTDFGSCHYLGASTLTHQLPPPGTPQYASPESQRFQWRWRRQPSARYEATAADDVYALGMTAYRLVTGRYPPDPTEAEVFDAVDDVDLYLPPLVPPERLVHLIPELARLIRQMLSEDPKARGSMAEVAYALEQAERSAERYAHQLIIPIGPLTPDTRTPALAQERPSRPWHRWFMVTAASVALAINLWAVMRMRPVESEAMVETGLPARDGNAKEAGTAELGEAALAERVGTAAPGPVRGGISLDMPKEPLPGQHRPPCDPPEVEVNGGCWWDLRNGAPPCGKRAYLWKNRCYSPSLGPPRPATSGQK